MIILKVFVLCYKSAIMVTKIALLFLIVVIPC